MKIRILPAVLALSALAFAATAQTNGSMSGQTTDGAMMTSHPDTGCTSGQNHMSGGAMSGGSMARGNHMMANNTGCQPAQKPNP